MVDQEREIKRKEFLLEEIKELSVIVVYLAVSFSVLATLKSLVLIQVGVNDFVHGYTTALIEALALGKIVMLAQRLPILNSVQGQPLIYSSVVKAVIMTLVVYVAGQAEEHIFARKVAEANLKQELIMTIAHLISFFLVFYALFVARGLDRALGHGRLSKLLLSAPETGPHDS